MDANAILDGPKADPEEIAFYLEHRVPEIWESAQELQELLVNLDERAEPAATRVHPLPVAEGYAAFLEQAWKA
jgi:hypothetical protein